MWYWQSRAKCMKKSFRMLLINVRKSDQAVMNAEKKTQQQSVSIRQIWMNKQLLIRFHIVLWDDFLIIIETNQSNLCIMLIKINVCTNLDIVKFRVNLITKHLISLNLFSSLQSKQRTFGFDFTIVELFQQWQCHLHMHEWLLVTKLPVCSTYSYEQNTHQSLFK